MEFTSEADRKSTWAAMAVAVVMIGQQLAGKALRDGFFLSHFEAEALPIVMTGASILSIVLVFATTRILKRFSPARSLPVFFAGNGVLFLIEGLFATTAPRVAAVSLFFHTTSFGAVVVSSFWSVVNERFDPHTAKLVIGRIAGSATVGGVLGGLAAWRGAALLSVPQMVLGLGLLNLLCAAAAARIGGVSRPRSATELSALRVLEETPYLRQLGLLVGLVAFAAAVYDYVFKARAATYFATDAELVSFFALFYLGLGITTFVVQSLFAKRSLRYLGLAVTVGMLPGVTIGVGVLALLLPSLATAIALRGGTAVVESSLYRSGYELLYTPLPEEKKRPTKALIDVGGDKLGAAAGGAFAFFVLGLVPTGASAVLLVVGVGAGAAALFATAWLHRGYVATLASSLRAGSIDADAVSGVDAVTSATVAETMAAIDRAEVLAGLERRSATTAGETEAIARLREAVTTGTARARPARSTAFRDPPRDQTLEESDVDGHLLAIADLRSGDVARQKEALRRHDPLPVLLIAHVLILLEDDLVADDAAQTLRRVAPVHVGLLLDAALRARTPITTRRRIIEVLGTVATARSLDGLVRLLGDHEFEIRFRAASAILQILEHNAALEPPRDGLFAAAAAEASASRRHWLARVSVDERIATARPHETETGQRVMHGLAYVFTLLLAALDRGPLRLALLALASEDSRQRGTGLEYLDNVLPPQLKREMWPLLVDHELTRGAVRSEVDILAELADASRPTEMDLAALRRRLRERARGATTAEAPDRRREES